MTSISFSSISPFEQDRIVRQHGDSLAAVFADDFTSAIEFRTLVDDHGFVTLSITREEYDAEAEAQAAQVRATIYQHAEGLVTFGG